MPDPISVTDQSVLASAPAVAEPLADSGDQLLVPPDDAPTPPSTRPADAKEPAEGGAKPDAKPDAKAPPPPGYRSEDDFRKLEGNLHRQLNERQREAEQLRQYIEQVTSSQAVEAQIEASRQQVREWLQSQGVDPATQGPQVDAIAQTMKRAIENDQRAKALEAQAQQAQGLLVNTLMGSWIHELRYQNKLEADDVQTLQSLFSPDAIKTREDMVRIGIQLGERAKQLGEIKAAAAAARRGRQAAVPAQQFENGQGAGGMTDQQIVEAFADGKLNDFKQAEDAMKRLGTW